MLSAWFLTSMDSFFFLSSSPCFFDSSSIFLMSSSERPDAGLIEIVCSLPVPWSFAETWIMPFASMSKVTSIWGMPLGAGGIPMRSNLPSGWLSAAIARSPCKTLIVTAAWLSAAVENTCDFLVGIVVFFSISFVKTLPRVSMPSDSGVTSRSSTSFTSPERTPDWMAAPMATTSSGFTVLFGSFANNSWTAFCTAGILVCPPTSITSFMSDVFRPASLRACLQGAIVLSTRSSVSCSSFALVSV